MAVSPDGADHRGVRNGYHGGVSWGHVRAAWGTAIAGVALAGCLRADTYACEHDAQCHNADASGRCLNGWCAYPAAMCPSGFAFSPYADPGVADECVPDAASTEGIETDDAPTDGESQDSGGPDVCSDGCDTPPGPCSSAAGACDDATQTCTYPPAVVGTPCDDDDPCSGTSVCDGAGQCVAQTPVVCNQPPSTCYAATGTCDPNDGACVYEPAAAGSPCEDGDGCTVGDACDETGACVPGAVCPNDNPCQVAACEGGTCVTTPHPDGTSCGANAADRCCVGTCVDVSSDPLHCGGCGYACNGGKSCETVAATNECSPAPANETGRCTCDANGDCPGSQICRTVAPGANRCAPPDAGGCDGVFVDVVDCPNYCTY